MLSLTHRPIRLAPSLATLAALWLSLASLDVSGAPTLACPVGPEPLPSAQSSGTRFTSDHLEKTPENQLHLSGQVEAVQKDWRMTSERMDYNQATQTLTVPQGVSLSGASLQVKAQSLMARDARYFELQQAAFTRCLREDPDWYFKADQVIIDQDADQAKIWQGVLWFKGLPIFYVPYFTSPLSNRQTGLLFASPGTDRQDDFFRQPLYLNLAPWMDNTLTLTQFAQRGTQWDNEFRVLLGPQAQATWLYGALDDQRTQSQRHYSHLNLTGQAEGGWRYQLNYRDQSDKNYYRDMIGHDLERSTLTYTNQLHITHQQPLYATRLTLEQAILLNSLTDGYIKRPELIHQHQGQWRDWGWRLEAIATDFDHPNPNQVRGLRGVSRLQTTQLFEAPWGYIQPTLGIQASLINTQTQQESDQDAFVIPWLKLESGAYFDRFFGAQKNWTQSLIPRLNYLRVAHHDQNALPLFDSAAGDITSLEGLTTPYLYSGYDRLIDQNRLTASLSHEINDPQGNTLLSLTLGKAHTFEDARNPLPISLSEPLNAWYGEAKSQFHDFSLRAQWMQPDEERRPNYRTASLYWSPDPNKIVQARWSHTPLGESAQLGFHLPLAQSRFQLTHYSNFDLTTDSLTESYTGLAYESCCWAIRLYQERKGYLAGTDKETTYQLQFELKDMASMGSSLESLFQQRITGYQPK